MPNIHRRNLRRAESRLFEAIEAADAGERARALQLLARATVPRRARRSMLADERAAILAEHDPWPSIPSP